MADTLISVLEKYSTGIDHVAVAVTNLQKSIEFYQNCLGFKLTERRLVNGEYSGMDSATMESGNVRFVLVEATNEKSNVAQYIKNYGPGVQHVAISVNNIEAVVLDLKTRKFEFITDIIKAPGLKQIFSTRDPISGIMIEIIQRTEGQEGFNDVNVGELFKAMESKGIY